MRMKWISGCVLVAVFCATLVSGQETSAPLTLEESIKIALNVSLQVHSAIEGVLGSTYRQKEAITNFLPLWTGQYGYTRSSSPILTGFTTPGGAGISGRDSFSLSTTVSEPLFTGGLNLANYRLQKLGVDVSKTNVDIVKRDVVLQVRAGYFNILRTLKLRDVAEQTVKQFRAQLDVANAFFEVGLVAKNDVLQAEVSLANAMQGLIRAENDLALAKSSFNTLLRRDINTRFEVVDILEYRPFPMTFEESLKEAMERRQEIKTADLVVRQAQEGVKIARSAFFPTVTLGGNYNRSADTPGLQGEFASERWTVQTVASFTLWNWGFTQYKVGESKVQVAQAQDTKGQILDSVTLEVKQDYLNMMTAERNVSTSSKAVEQAEENLRMTEERYRYQVSTATDVLIAVTLLDQARTNYYSALADFNIARSQLERAMGRI
jgi:outer membrane protein